MRKPFIAGNWKMNLGPVEGAKLAKELKEKVKNESCRVLVAPPFVTIASVKKELEGTNILIGAQNMSDQEKGAFTGEVSADMLIQSGVSVVILGHSERRAYYHEDDAFINRKVKLALKKGLEVILCIGETLEERKSGQLEKVLSTQISGGLKDLSKDDMKKVTIAYEPVWAIGTGVTATKEDANETQAFVRAQIKELFGDSIANNVIIQYGGSVKPNNVKDLMSQEHIDGALVGGASLTSENFVPIVLFDK